MGGGGQRQIQTCPEDLWWLLTGPRLGASLALRVCCPGDWRVLPHMLMPPSYLIWKVSNDLQGSKPAGMSIEEMLVIEEHRLPGKADSVFSVSSGKEVQDSTKLSSGWWSCLA